MSLPPFLSAGFDFQPDRGKASLKVYFTDKSKWYDAIEETGTADTIDEHGNHEDYIHEE